MALKKKIQKSNGLILEYHRISMLKIDTNLQCTILVESYLNEESRLKEKEILKVGIDKDGNLLNWYFYWLGIFYRNNQRLNAKEN